MALSSGSPIQSRGTMGVVLPKINRGFLRHLEGNYINFPASFEAFKFAANQLQYFLSGRLDLN
jgi:hypothetical protein